MIFLKYAKVKVRLGVSDEGSGIRDEDKHKLFESYYCVANKPRTVSGFGIAFYLYSEILKDIMGNLGKKRTGKGIFILLQVADAIEQS